MMKLKELKCNLQSVESFDYPKVLLEQYATSADIAANILYAAHTSYDDISDKIIADFGCGCGIFMAGSCMLGAVHAVGFDIDHDALKISSSNLEMLDLMQECELVHADVLQLPNTLLHKFDTIFMNPPFGTKHNQGIDMAFVKSALSCCEGAVYSLHKSSTRKFIKRKGSDWSVKVEVLAELRFDLPATYKHHKKDTKDIQVDLIRFQHNK